MANQTPIEIARELLHEALQPHIKGRNAAARLSAAAEDALASIEHLLTVRQDVKKGRLGATVMTRDASLFNSPPRAL